VLEESVIADFSALAGARDSFQAGLRNFERINTTLELKTTLANHVRRSKHFRIYPSKSLKSELEHAVVKISSGRRFLDGMQPYPADPTRITVSF
jgi:hypothetical protein